MSKPGTPASIAEWEQQLHSHLPLYGHRNWIVVADAAYPSQCAVGVETIVADADQLEVIRKVVDAIAAAPHVSADIFTDEELSHLTEEDARGIENYRQRLAHTLEGLSIETSAHDQIIARLDQAAKTFHVLLIKTRMTLPYTSVFFQLGCGYWNADAEDRLRMSMASPPKR